MRTTFGSEGFGRIRSRLLKQQPTQLVRLIGELYRLSKENQRFLEARLGGAPKQLPMYRQLVADCLGPDPLRKGAKVRIADAKRAISQYERATGDVAGTAELMLTFVEQGTGLPLTLDTVTRASSPRSRACCHGPWAASNDVRMSFAKICGLA